MKKFGAKRIVAAGIAGVLVVGAIIGVNAADFSGHWAESGLSYLKDERIIRNLDDMEAETEVTLGEFLTAASKVYIERVTLDMESGNDSETVEESTDEETDESEVTDTQSDGTVNLSRSDCYDRIFDAYKELGGQITDEDAFIDRQSAYVIIGVMSEMLREDEIESDETDTEDSDETTTDSSREEDYSGIIKEVADADDVQDWAKEAAFQAITSGYACGYSDGTIKPENIIIWEEVSSLMYYFGNNERVMGFPGTYEFGEINGATIYSSDVTLQNTIVNGDMYLHTSIGSGTVNLKNVTVTGTIYIQSPLTKLEMDANSSAGDIVQLTDVYADGVWTGKASGFRGTITVNVTITGGTISDITVVSHSDDTAYFNRAKSVLTSILSKQSTSVDSVSGATYSSKGLMAAVEDALSQAAGLTSSPGESSASQSTSTGSDSATGTPVAGASSTTGSRIDYSNYIIEDGVWTGSATGYGGTLTVSVTVSGGVIKSVEITSHNETYAYLLKAQKSVISAIVNSNSTKVDTVSGATYSSNAIIAAVDSALNGHLTLKTAIKSWETYQDESLQWHVTVTMMSGTSVSDITFKLDGETVTGSVSDDTVTFNVSESNTTIQAYTSAGKLLATYTIDFSNPYVAPSPDVSNPETSPSPDTSDPNTSDPDTSNPDETSPSPSTGGTKVITKTATVASNEYTASYTMTINVTITDSIITNVALVSHTSQQSDDSMFMEIAIDYINSQLPSSSTSYDTMCHATLSANAIVAAIQSALASY